MTFRDWLSTQAFPFWLQVGLDHHHGGFHERLDDNLRPTRDTKRARLTARQIYCFLVAHEMGVPGAQDAVIHGMAFLRSELLTPEGRLLMSVDVHTGEARAGFDPYDHAFVLFALASGARVLPGYEDWEAMASLVTKDLFRHRHPEYGFSEPDALKANPHMHLLESFLAWEDVSGQPMWPELADEMVDLCMHRLSSGLEGAVLEYFDDQWRPDTRRLVIEPGHQFEWAWLLMRWAESRKREDAFLLAVRLVDFAERRGLMRRGPLKVAVNALDSSASISDSDAKLWPQTERWKAHECLAGHPFAGMDVRELAGHRAQTAAQVFRAYLRTDVPGTWSESLGPWGWNRSEIKASSFYHVVNAIEQAEPWPRTQERRDAA